MTPLLTIEGLSARWGATPAVDGVSLSVAPGRSLGLVGESGSGKSTVVQAAFRWLPPPAVVTGGRVVLALADGPVDVLALDPAALRRLWWARVALVPQSALASLDPLHTVGAHAAETVVAHGRSAREARPMLAARLLDVGLDPALADRYPHELSGGQRQRVAIALARLLDPPLLVLDEPTTALDVVVERELVRALLDVQARDGFAMIFVTHDLPLLLQFADEIAVLYAGRLVERGPAARVAEAALHPYPRGLLAAMPAGPEEDRAPVSIPGTPPDLRAPPPGCRFHPRCSLATDRCRTEAPPLRVADRADHLVACHAVPA